MSSRAPLRRWSLAIASGVALLAVTPPTAAAQRYSSLTFFGDSFTDMGMADLLAAFGGIADPTSTPPYAPGTFTNGPTWAAYFANLLGHPADAAPALAGGNNFAIGGARTGLLGTGGYPIGLLSQLSLFGGGTPIPGLPPLGPRPIDPTGLYVVWGGVNDIRDAAELPAAQQLPAVQNAVTNVAFITRTLALGGANTLLVPLAANSGLAP